MLIPQLFNFLSFTTTFIFPIILTIKSIKLDSHIYLKFLLHYWLVVGILYQLQLSFNSTFQAIPYFNYFIAAVKLWLLLPYYQGCLIICYDYIFPLMLNDTNEANIEIFFNGFFKSSLFTMIVKVLLSYKLSNEFYLRLIRAAKDLDYIYNKSSSSGSGSISFLEYCLNKVCVFNFNLVSRRNVMPIQDTSQRVRRRSSRTSFNELLDVREELMPKPRSISQSRSPAASVIGSKISQSHQPVHAVAATQVYPSNNHIFGDMAHIRPLKSTSFSRPKELPRPRSRSNPQHEYSRDPNLAAFKDTIANSKYNQLPEPFGPSTQDDVAKRQYLLKHSKIPFVIKTTDHEKIPKNKHVRKSSDGSYISYDNQPKRLTRTRSSSFNEIAINHGVVSMNHRDVPKFI